MVAQGEFVIQLTRVCHLKVIKWIDVFFFFLIQVLPKSVKSLSGPHRPVTEGDNVTLTCNITSLDVISTSSVLNIRGKLN